MLIELFPVGTGVISFAYLILIQASSFCVKLPAYPLIIEISSAH